MYNKPGCSVDGASPRQLREYMYTQVTMQRFCHTPWLFFDDNDNDNDNDDDGGEGGGGGVCATGVCATAYVCTVLYSRYATLAMFALYIYIYIYTYSLHTFYQRYFSPSPPSPYF